MDTNFLVNFLSVVETGSIAEAARRANLSPTALSQQVRALEKELGVQLTTRAGRTVVPTESGRRILDLARALQQNVNAIRSAAVDSEQARELRLGTINTTLQSFVPDTLAALTRARPQLNVFIETGVAEHLLEHVQASDIDCAIVPLPQFELPKRLNWKLLVAEPLILLAPGYMAAHDPHLLLCREPFIRYNRQTWGGRLADNYLREAGIAPKERFELSSLVAIAIMVDRGLGVSLIPDSMYPAPPGLNLVKHALPMPSEPRRIGMVWQRACPREELILDFIGRAEKIIAAWR
ncbi:LysR family transcriptional regulator [Candidimonas humi]|jgi:DNA-binding transcriptional LysR family regulator|uniref:LysR family transcriptional regulator n=1 Tax=Candidimonas humi TaxID=683355 RepID=A0ABV8P1H3_9BURK|nr:LysR family transcriptional regulator [Candidimonas humi]MBV6307235.1 LysR family transcriptional regulator [Candidimonas humi]